MSPVVVNRLILAFFLLLALVGCDGPNSQARVVRASYVPAGYYLPFLIVQNDGLLEKRGYSLELKKFQDNADMISLFLNGHLDVTAQSAFTMFPVEVRHPGMFKFVYAQFAKSYYFVVPERSSFSKLSDLKGATIGTWKSPTAEAFIRILLRQSGLTDAQYKINRYGATEWPDMIKNSTVSVVFGFDVLAQTLVDSGKFRFLEKDALASLLTTDSVFNGGAFIATQLITDDPAKANAIREALLESIEIIRKEPTRVNTIVSRTLSIPVTTSQNATYDEFVWPNSAAVRAARETARLLSAEGFLQEAIPTDSLFWRGD